MQIIFSLVAIPYLGRIQGAGAAMISSQQSIATDLFQQLSDASRGAAADYLVSARVVLERLLARPGLLGALSLDRNRGAYARNLLFGDDRMSIWAMVWDVGARTSIHDHHCSCCFGVLSGSIREIRYDAVSDTAAVMTGQAWRGTGYIACMLPTGPNLHQMVNDGESEAISLHIYGFDHHLHASSVHREYRVAAN
jgi:predicted metal-dependent enzyme (double-stranded beta helix superfamily)